MKWSVNENKNNQNPATTTTTKNQTNKKQKQQNFTHLKNNKKTKTNHDWEAKKQQLGFIFQDN